MIDSEYYEDGDDDFVHVFASENDRMECLSESEKEQYVNSIKLLHSLIQKNNRISWFKEQMLWEIKRYSPEYIKEQELLKQYAEEAKKKKEDWEKFGKVEAIKQQECNILLKTLNFIDTKKNKTFVESLSEKIIAKVVVKTGAHRTYYFCSEDKLQKFLKFRLFKKVHDTLEEVGDYLLIEDEDFSQVAFSKKMNIYVPLHKIL